MSAVNSDLVASQFFPYSPRFIPNEMVEFTCNHFDDVGLVRMRQVSMAWKAFILVNDKLNTKMKRFCLSADKAAAYEIAINRNDNGWALLKFIRVEALNDLCSARETAETMPTRYFRRGEAHIAVVKAIAQRDLPSAMAWALTHEYQGQMLAGIVEVLAPKDIEAAEAVAEKIDEIEDYESRLNAADSIFTARAQKDVPAALVAAKNYHEGESQALLIIVNELLSQMNVFSAKQIAKDIPGFSEHNKAFCNIIIEQIQLDDLPGAIETFKTHRVGGLEILKAQVRINPSIANGVILTIDTLISDQRERKLFEIFVVIAESDWRSALDFGGIYFPTSEYLDRLRFEIVKIQAPKDLLLAKKIAETIVIPHIRFDANLEITKVALSRLSLNYFIDAAAHLKLCDEQFPLREQVEKDKKDTKDAFRDGYLAYIRLTDPELLKKVADLQTKLNEMKVKWKDAFEPTREFISLNCRQEDLPFYGELLNLNEQGTAITKIVEWLQKSMYTSKAEERIIAQEEVKELAARFIQARKKLRDTEEGKAWRAALNPFEKSIEDLSSSKSSEELVAVLEQKGSSPYVIKMAKHFAEKK